MIAQTGAANNCIGRHYTSPCCRRVSSKLLSNDLCQVPDTSVGGNDSRRLGYAACCTERSDVYIGWDLCAGAYNQTDESCRRVRFSDF